MPWRLHSYILLELLKTFVLTVIVTSVLFLLGGGVYNALRYEGITAANLINLLPMLIPIALTVTTPVAALFAATIVYGRFAADNEFVACRAAGINVHGLFLPAVLLAVGVALLSLFATNVLMPSYVEKIESYARAHLRDWVFSKLRESGYIERKDDDSRLIFTARAVKHVTDGALIDSGRPPESELLQYLWVDWPTVMVVQGGRMEEFIVAQGALCRFDRSSGDVQVSVEANNLRRYELGASSVTMASPELNEFRPPRFPERPAMANLGRLWQLAEAPWQLRKLGRTYVDFATRYFAERYLGEVAVRLAAGEAVRFSRDDGERFELTAVTATVGQRALQLGEVELVQTQPEAAPIRYAAPRATLRVGRVDDTPLAELVLEGDEFGDARRFSPVGGEVMRTTAPRFPFPRLTPDPTDAAAAAPPGPAELADGDPQVPEAFAEDLARLRKETGRMRRKIAGLVHSRFGVASSALVTVLMGAILGVMFRGARILAAIGLACLPVAATALVIVTGQRIIESAGTPGVTVIWGGLAAAAVIDFILMRTGVRR